MKNSNGIKIKLGAFVTAGFVILILGIYFIGARQQMFSTTFRVSGVFNDISGLQIGNNIRFCGINIGMVDAIRQITDSTVMVEMEIEESSRKFIKKNSVAFIGSDGLMGNKIILIIPDGSSQLQLADNDTLQTSMPVSMDDILENIELTSEHAATITEDLAIIMESIRLGKGTIGKLLMDTLMAENVDDALLNIKQGAGGFKQNMDAASHNVLLRGFLKKKSKKKNGKK